MLSSMVWLKELISRKGNFKFKHILTGTSPTLNERATRGELGQYALAFTLRVSSQQYALLHSAPGMGDG